jgi:hypothetical protein
MKSLPNPMTIATKFGDHFWIKPDIRKTYFVGNLPNAQPAADATPRVAHRALKAWRGFTFDNAHDEISTKN